MIPDAALAQLKADRPCADVASGWVRLRKHGTKMVGPCPVCSKDRQSKKDARFEADGEGFVCAVCADGGDVIKLVMNVEGLEFKGAVDWLGGVRESNPTEAARRESERAEKEAARDRNAQLYRDRQRGNLYDIWNHAQAPAGTAVEAYLGRRRLKLPPSAPKRLRCVPDMPYFVHGGKDAAVIHRGPAMVAPIVRADGKFSGLHFTWIDLAQPNGKAAIKDPETGELLSTKKVRGSKTGGIIPLVKANPMTRLVIGEGIETVLSVWLALHEIGRDLAGLAFWSAVDLGNLGGKSAGTVVHPELVDARGRARRVPGPDPDTASPAIVLPAEISEVVLLGDGDSDSVLTECALYRAQTRFLATRNDRVVRVALAPIGLDFNDLLNAPL
jgi:hypothetical protein